MVMMNTMPHIELHIMESDEERGGVGEPGTPPIAPAADECNLCCVGRTYSVACH